LAPLLDVGGKIDKNGVCDLQVHVLNLKNPNYLNFWRENVIMLFLKNKKEREEGLRDV
jgi:hypothetical protein